jgi:hypothetical protein
VEFYGNHFPLHSLVLKLTVENVLNCSKNCLVAVQNYTSNNHLRKLTRAIISNESCHVTYSVSTPSMETARANKLAYGNITDKLVKSIHSGYFDLTFHANAVTNNDTALQTVVCGNTTSTSYSVSEPEENGDNLGIVADYFPSSDVILSSVLPSLGILFVLGLYFCYINRKSAPVFSDINLPASERNPHLLFDVFPLFGVCVAHLYSYATFTNLLLNFPPCCGHLDFKTPHLVALPATAIGATCIDVVVLSLWVINDFNYMYKNLHYYFSTIYQLLSLIFLWILVDNLGYYSQSAGIAALCGWVYSGYDLVQTGRKYDGKTLTSGRAVSMMFGFLLIIMGLTPILFGLSLTHPELIYNPQPSWDMDASPDGWILADDRNTCTNYYLFSSSFTARDGGIVDQYCTPNTTVLSTQYYHHHDYQFQDWNLNKGCCFWRAKP